MKRNSMVQDVTQRRLYDSVRWRKVRRMWLAEHPLCAMCTRQGRTTAAVVVDHVKPHEGDHELFWDQNNYQSLCYSCHSGIKRQQERHWYSQAADANGLPMDSGHPWSKGRT